MSTLNILLKSQDGITLNTKGKYCDKNILVAPQLEDKTVTPTTEQQIITASDGYAGIRQVIVKATHGGGGDTIENYDGIVSVL